jgi:hypothetical protein
MADKFDKWWWTTVELFQGIQKEIGLEDARRIFKEIAGPSTPKQKAGWKNAELVARFVCMAEPNVQRLARDLAEENRNLPRELRHGPTGSTNPAVLEKQIRRLLAKRKSKQDR